MVLEVRLCFISRVGNGEKGFKGSFPALSLSFFVCEVGEIPRVVSTAWITWADMHIS